MGLDTPTSAPDPQGDDFIDFLHWYADQCMLSTAARDVIAVLEKPHHFADDYARYLSAGGVNR